MANNAVYANLSALNDINLKSALTVAVDLIIDL